MKRIVIASLLAVFLIGGILSCKKTDAPTETKTVVKDSLKMVFRGPHYTLYSLKEGKEIPIADSATTKWDFAISFSNIIVNSHASGPGQAGIIAQYGIYNDFKTAPTTGYAYDTTTTRLAIDGNPKSPNAWYVYNPVNHGFAPKAGLFFVLKTADGKYAKLEITDVNYADYPTGSMYPNFLIYKFRYLYQRDGSTNLSE